MLISHSRIYSVVTVFLQPTFCIFETTCMFLAHASVRQVKIPAAEHPSSHSLLAHDGFTAGHFQSL